MRNNIIEKVMANHPNLSEFVNGMEFIKNTHSLYKDIGGMKNNRVAKGIIKYVTAENELCWNYVVQFVYYVMEGIDKKGTMACKEDIDWQEACCMCFPKELKQIDTKRAFKELFKILAYNNEEDTDELLAEPILNAYGWPLIVKKLVGLYEEILCTSTEYAEQNPLHEQQPDCIMEEENISDAPAEENNILGENKDSLESSSTDLIIETSTDSPIHKEKATSNKKYARGRSILLTGPDGEITEWSSVKAINKEIGIPEGSIRKCVTGHSTSIRYNNQKYVATYKEAC